MFPDPFRSIRDLDEKMDQRYKELNKGFSDLMKAIDRLTVKADELSNHISQLQKTMEDLNQKVSKIKEM